MGIDCSGFTQVIFKQLGIDLPRDAWQQADAGKEAGSFADVQCGDLVFFGNKERITHVGILLGDGTMIHASGRVKIDVVNENGVVDITTGKLSLKIKAIKRFM
jgi:cell wall-associated NlpC family hydrolase